MVNAYDLSKRAIAKMQAVIIAIIVVVAVIAGVAYYIFSFQGAPSPAGEVPNEICAGTVLPLSGPFSVEGSAALLGMQAAVKWVNDHGGVKLLGRQVPLKLVYYDDESKVDYATKLAEKVITEDKAHVFIHDWATFSEFTAAVTERAGIFSIQWSSNNENLWGQGFKYMTTCIAQTTDCFKHPLKVIRDADPNAKSVALMWRSQPGIELWAGGIRKYATEYGFNVVYDRGYPPDMTDASPMLREISTLNPDALLVCCFPPDGYLIVSQLRDLRVNIKWVVCPIIVLKPEFAEAFNKWGVGFMAYSNWEPEIEWEKIAATTGIEYVGATNKELMNIYSEMGGTGRPASEYGMTAAPIFLLKKIIEVAQSLDADKLIEATKSIDVYTCRGRFKVDPNEPLKQIGLDAPPIVVQWQREGNKITYEILYPYEAKTSNAIPMPTWEEKETWPTLEIQYFH